MKIGRLEEKATAHGHVARVKIVRDQRARLGHLLLVKRSVARMEHRSGHDFIHRKKIGQQAALGTVELFEKPQAKMLVELIRALRIDDVYGVDPLSIQDAIERDSAVVDVLLKCWFGWNEKPNAPDLLLP